MAKPVTIEQLGAWVKKNEHRTWNISNWKKGAKQRTFEVKYIDFTLDTRDMKIFRLSTRSFADLEADFREEFDGTILELLEDKLEKWNKRTNDEVQE